MMAGMPPGMGGGQYGDLLAMLKSGDPAVMAGIAELLQLEDQGEPQDQGSPFAAALRGGGMGGNMMAS